MKAMRQPAWLCAALRRLAILAFSSASASSMFSTSKQM
jgi:hypothetical protein